VEIRSEYDSRWALIAARASLDLITHKPNTNQLRAANNDLPVDRRYSSKSRSHQKPISRQEKGGAKARAEEASFAKETGNIEDVSSPSEEVDHGKRR
jgi:hypothetical protein